MRRAHVLYLVFFAAALGSAGCSSSNKGKIEGTKWNSQTTTVKGNTIPAGALGLEFTKDGKLIYRIGPQTVTGSYSLGWGDRVTLNLDQDLPGGKGKTHTEKITIDGDKLTMTDSDGTAVTFDRVKEGGSPVTPLTPPMPPGMK